MKTSDLILFFVGHLKKVFYSVSLLVIHLFIFSISYSALGDCPFLLGCPPVFIQCRVIILVVWSIFFTIFSRKSSWKQYSLRSCLLLIVACVFYTWNSVWLNIKSLAYIFFLKCLKFVTLFSSGIKCCWINVC